MIWSTVLVVSLPSQNPAVCWDGSGLCGSSSSIPPPVSCGPISWGRTKDERGKLKRQWKKMEIHWSVSRFFPRVAVLSLQQRRSESVCGPAAYKHVPVTQDNSSLQRPPNKHTNAHFGHLTLPPPILYSPFSQPSPSLRFISMADGLCRAVGIQYFHDVSQTHLGLNILFTSSQHSENHNNTELRQKFRTHYSWLRSQPRLKSSPLLCHDVFRKQSLLLLLFSPLFPICTLHVFVSCFVSKSPSSHIRSRYGGPQDNGGKREAIWYSI